jgi:hypothetical protein
MNPSTIFNVKVKLSLCFFLNWAPRVEGVFWEWQYSSTHSLNSAFNRSEWPDSRSGRFIPRERSPRYSLDRRLGGPQSRSGRGGEEKNSQPLPGLEPPIFHPVAQRYTTEVSWILLRKYGKIQIFGKTAFTNKLRADWIPQILLGLSNWGGWQERSTQHVWVR